jgi:hypothetical protein
MEVRILFRTGPGSQLSGIGDTNLDGRARQQQGKLIAAHRLQPIPHAFDSPGFDDHFQLTVSAVGNLSHVGTDSGGHFHVGVVAGTSYSNTRREGWHAMPASLMERCQYHRKQSEQLGEGGSLTYL